MCSSDLLLKDFAKKIESFTSMTAEIKQLKAAVDLADENHRLYKKEYDSGLVSLLDVLRSFDDSLTLERSLNHRISQQHILYHQLKAAAGDLP